MNTPQDTTEEKNKQIWTVEKISELFSKPSYLDEPTKPIDAKKPINGFDFLNALARIPEVQKDLEVISKKPTKEKKLKICNKYFGLEIPLMALINSKCFYKYNKHFHRSNAIHVFSNREKDTLNTMSEYRDGRHVILAVDITKKKGDIIKEFKEVLDKVGKDYDIKKDTSKNKDTVEDIWKIYDYKTKDSLFLVEIARRLSGRKGSPAYDETLESYRQKVKRAYRKAEGIINTVKQEVEETIIANEKRKKAEDEFKEMLNRMAKESTKKERTLSIGEQLTQHMEVDE